MDVSVATDFPVVQCNQTFYSLTQVMKSLIEEKGICGDAEKH